MAREMVSEPVEIQAPDFVPEDIMIVQTNLLYFYKLEEILTRYSFGPYVKFVISFPGFGQRGYLIFLDVSDPRFKQFVKNWCVKSKDRSVEWLHLVESLQRAPNAWDQPRENWSAEYYREFDLRSAIALRLNVSDSESLKAFLDKYSLWDRVRLVTKGLPRLFGKDNKKRADRGYVIFIDALAGSSQSHVITSWARKDLLVSEIAGVYFVHPNRESWGRYQSPHTPRQNIN